MNAESSLTPSAPTFDLTHLWRQFFECSPQPKVIVEGSAHLVRQVNAAFLRLAGVAETELLGSPFADVVLKGEADACRAVLERVFRTGTPENLAEQKHGATPPVYWSYAVWPLRAKDGGNSPVGLAIQVTDSTGIAVFRAQAAAINEKLVLSSLRQMEQAQEAKTLSASLQTALKAKDHFLAVLSHELRNPLNPVLATATMLCADPRFDADTREQLQVIRRNVELEARLIDDLLDVTRIERGKVELDKTPVELGTVIRHAVEVCLSDIEAQKLEFGIDAPDGPYWVDADATRLLQVFWNLLKNAIKFTPHGGCVGVRCRGDGDGHVIAEVNDSGEGIDPDLLPRLFSAFEQGGKQTTRQFGGLGLGLAISRAIVDLHGGTLTAHSEGKGKGATFALRLPLLPAEAAIPATPTTPEALSTATPARPLRILLVEDHGDTARIMRRLLSAEGHEVQVAADVATALKLATAQSFDLLLSDLGLPDGSGLDLMRAIRAKGLKLPGIAVSGYGQEQDVQQCREAGFAAHLLKPVSLPKLDEAIAKVIGYGTRIAGGGQEEDIG